VKTSRVCPKCGNKKIGHLKWLPMYSDSEARGEQYIGTSPGVRPKWSVGTFNNVHSIEAYICSSCGLLECYAQEPEKIPFEKLENFEWIS
jgi:hypothetical protein